jgi:hypothetical protein
MPGVGDKRSRCRGGFLSTSSWATDGGRPTGAPTLRSALAPSCEPDAGSGESSWYDWTQATKTLRADEPDAYCALNVGQTNAREAVACRWGTTLSLETCSVLNARIVTKIAGSPARYLVEPVVLTQTKRAIDLSERPRPERCPPGRRLRRAPTHFESSPVGWRSAPGLSFPPTQPGPSGHHRSSLSHSRADRSKADRGPRWSLLGRHRPVRGLRASRCPRQR